MSFRNSILAGTTLARNDIQSEGFQTGIAGWIIERLGDAEFNDLVARGIINATELRVKESLGFSEVRVLTADQDSAQGQTKIVFDPGHTDPIPSHGSIGLQDKPGEVSTFFNGFDGDLASLHLTSPDLKPGGRRASITATGAATNSTGTAYENTSPPGSPIPGYARVSLAAQGSVAEPGSIRLGQFGNHIVLGQGPAYQIVSGQGTGTPRIVNISGGSTIFSGTNSSNLTLTPSSGSGRLNIITVLSLFMHATRRYRILGLTRAHPTNSGDFGAIIAANIEIDSEDVAFDRTYLPDSTATQRTIPLRPEAPDYIPATSGNKTLRLVGAERDSLSGNVAFRGSGGGQFEHKLVVWDMGPV